MSSDNPQTAPVQISPLVEAAPHSIDELFSRDPFSYTQQDRRQIVAELRRQRLTWDAAEAAGKAAPKAKKAAAGPKTPKAPAQAVGLEALGLLGLDGKQ